MVGRLNVYELNGSVVLGLRDGEGSGRGLGKYLFELEDHIIDELGLYCMDESNALTVNITSRVVCISHEDFGWRWADGGGGQGVCVLGGGRGLSLLEQWAF